MRKHSLKHQLKPFSKTENISINASLKLTKGKIALSFLLKGNLDSYLFPKVEKIQRANELWKATCFELFLANDDEVYYELNFSSSLAWNFYVLDAYRAESKALELEEEPCISFTYKDDECSIVFELESEVLDFEDFKYCNLATILLTRENERRFWAIKHLKDAPDFHNKNNFLKIT